MKALKLLLIAVACFLGTMDMTLATHAYQGDLAKGQRCAIICEGKGLKFAHVINDKLCGCVDPKTVFLNVPEVK